MKKKVILRSLIGAPIDFAQPDWCAHRFKYQLYHHTYHFGYH